jgi:small GTP-binding protein
LQIWDTAGQERYVNMTKSFFRRVNAVIFMFSIIDESSFKNVSKWMKIAFGEVHGSVTKLLVGTKMDLYE